MNGLEPGPFFLEPGQSVLLPAIRNGFAMILICINSFFQVPIIQIPAHGELIPQPGNLRTGRINAVLVG